MLYSQRHHVKPDTALLFETQEVTCLDIINMASFHYKQMYFKCLPEYLIYTPHSTMSTAKHVHKHQLYDMT